MPRLLLLNHVLLFLFCSICLGIGAASLIAGCPPPPTDAAEPWLFWISILMVVMAAAMLLTEWFTGIRWAAALVLLAAAGAAILTIWCIPGEAGDACWVRLVRIALWALAWAAMMCWFARLAYAARADR